jgi:hypothetical protein
VDPETVPGFSWQMAGALVHAADPLEGTASQLLADHFSYLGQMMLNGCQNNSAPYSCANNGCNYPGNPMSPEVPSMAGLQAWLTSYHNQGLYAGLWGVTYNNPEAEAHCMAEVANALHASGATPTFLIVDGEKSYETNQDYSQRFVGQFNSTIAFPIAKGYTPECHIDVPFHVWLGAGFGSIQPQAYWDDPGVGVDPAYCLDWLYSHGVPKAKAQVMFDGYRHFTPHTAADYGAEMSSRGAVGFSIWRTLAPNEWDQWKPVIETGVATYAGSTSTTPPATCSAVGARQCVSGDAYEECVSTAGSPAWSSPGSCSANSPGTTCSGGYCVGTITTCGYVGPNTKLAPGERITSCDGRFTLIMQSSDGNLVLYMGSTPLWASNVLNHAGAYAIMQDDGNLVEYQGSTPLWSTKSYGHAGAHVSVQNDGNLVVYAHNGTPLWSSGTYGH